MTTEIRQHPCPFCGTLAFTTRNGRRAWSAFSPCPGCGAAFVVDRAGEHPRFSAPLKRRPRALNGPLILGGAIVGALGLGYLARVACGWLAKAFE